MSKKPVDSEPLGLINDREVASDADDRLGHRAIAEEVAKLVQQAPTPSNIALYGPWGSGKSGIANLLRDRLDDRREGPDGYRFARFDAFKYAENPLRRSLIAAVANELGLGEKKYPQFHGDLYKEVTTTGVDVDKNLAKPVAGLALIFTVSIVVIALLAVFAAWILSFPMHGPAGQNVGDVLKGVGGVAILLPATILTAFLALVGRSLTANRKVPAIDSDEGFERLFKQLVAVANVKKLVVFVDELDRCSPRDLVATLDAVRTFLGIDKCVFVVAADQQVLEHALTDVLEQPTPSDSANPYYSTGSAYLDKVFQYQVSIPTPIPEVMTKYAIDLIEGQPGVWTVLRNPEMTASVLVPSHVHSPRRVKHLLNAYAMSYAIARSRIASGELSTDLGDREDELARLVCVQVEFPLFARDLAVDPSLPDYIVALAELERTDDGELPATIEEPDDFWDKFRANADSRKLAKRYATGKASVARVIVAADDETERREVEAAHGRQLVEYLRRTASVRSPGQDLVHLQSTGPLFGLDTALADAIVDAALGNRVPDVLADHDAATRVASLKLLEQKLKTLRGIDAQNVARAILLIASDVSVTVPTPSDVLVEAVDPSRSLVPIDSRELALGAWRLGARSTRPASATLRRSVFTVDSSQWTDQLAVELVTDGTLALKSHGQDAGKVIASRLLVTDTTAVVDALANSSSDVRTPILRFVSTALRSTWTALNSALEGETDEDKAARADRQANVLRVFASLIKRIAEDSPGDAHSLVAVMLNINTKEARDAVSNLLSAVGKVSDPAAAIAVLSAASKRYVSDWPVWIDALEPGPFADGEAARVAVRDAATGAWNNEGDDEQRGVALTKLAALVDKLPPAQRPDISDVIVGALDGTDLTAVDLPTRLALVDRASRFVQARLADPQKLTDAEAAHLTRLLVGTPASPVDGPLQDYLRGTFANPSNRYSTLTLQWSDDAAKQLFEATRDSAWLPEPLKTELMMILWPVVGALEGVAPIQPETVGGLRAAHGRVADRALARWVAATGEVSAEALSAALGPALTDPDGMEGDLVDAFQRWVDAAPDAERTQLTRTLIGTPEQALAADSTLRAIGVGRRRLPEIPDILVERLKASSTDAGRSQVLDLVGRSTLSTKDLARLLDEIVSPLLSDEEASSETLVATLDLLAGLDRSVLKKVDGAKSDALKILVETVIGNVADGESHRKGLEDVGLLEKRKGILDAVKAIPKQFTRSSEDSSE